MSEQARKIDWYRTPIDKDLLKRLSQRSNLLGFRQTLGYFGLYALTAASALYSFGHWPWPITVLLVFCHGTVASFGGGAAMHELNHNTVFRTKWLNVFFAHVSSIISFWMPIGFGTSHLRHHAFTLHQPDDLEVTQPQAMPRGFWTFFKICVLNPQAPYHSIRATWRIARGQVEGEWMNRIIPPDDVEKRQRYRNWARFVLAFHAVLLVACVTLAIVMHWWILLMVPLLITFGTFYGGWLTFVLGMPQHYGLVDAVPDFRLSCRTYTTNPLFGLIYWQMNYHLDHHMYPTVPCYRLKQLHKAIEYDLPHTPRGVIACWRDMLAIARKQREDPKYLHRPTLPQDSTPAPELVAVS